MQHVYGVKNSFESESESVSHSVVSICKPVDCSPPGSSVHGILQAKIVEQVAMPSSGGTSLPQDRTHIPYGFCIDRWVLPR